MKLGPALLTNFNRTFSTTRSSFLIQTGHDESGYAFLAFGRDERELFNSKFTHDPIHSFESLILVMKKHTYEQRLALASTYAKYIPASAEAVQKIYDTIGSDERLTPMKIRLMTICSQGNSLEIAKVPSPKTTKQYKEALIDHNSAVIEFTKRLTAYFHDLGCQFEQSVKNKM